MTLLAVDASGKTSSTAIMRDNEIVCEQFLNVGLTHSETFLTQIDRAFGEVGISPRDIDYYAITVGPGSFTGLRIAIATIKGLAFQLDTPCVAISTLEALAEHTTIAFEPAIILPVIDAKRNRVYTAAYMMHSPHDKQQLLDDCILTFEQLRDYLSRIKHPVVFVGDASSRCYDYCFDIANCLPPSTTYENIYAGSVAEVALRKIASNDTIAPAALVPVYLQLSQAERNKLEMERTEHDSIGE